MTYLLKRLFSNEQTVTSTTAFDITVDHCSNNNIIAINIIITSTHSGINSLVINPFNPSSEWQKWEIAQNTIRNRNNPSQVVDVLREWVMMTMMMMMTVMVTTMMMAIKMTGILVSKLKGMNVCKLTESLV